VDGDDEDIKSKKDDKKSEIDELSAEVSDVEL
jgi:hypothetical protein